MSDHDHHDVLLHIHRGMDVFSAYQDRFIGSVVGILDSSTSRPGPSQEDGANPTGSEQPPPNVSLVHEEGAQVGSSEHRAAHRLGEEMGPVPTVAFGNSGPVTQSAENEYAIGRTASGTRCFVVRPGRLNLGPLTRPLYIPTSAVRSISMERIVVDVEEDRIPAEWRQRPTSYDQ